MDWDNPSDRYHLIEQVGPVEYERLQRQHFKQSTIETVNGYPIRAVSSRFGRIFMVDGLNAGHKTLEGAREIARKAPTK